jgi:hypothetical protein
MRATLDDRDATRKPERGDRVTTGAIAARVQNTVQSGRPGETKRLKGRGLMALKDAAVAALRDRIRLTWT